MNSTLVEHIALVPTRAAAFAQETAARVYALAPIPSVNPTAPPGGEKVMQIVGWVGWGVFVACVTGVLIICIKMGINGHKNRSGDGGGEEAGKLFWPLLGTIVGSGAGALLGAVSS